MEKNLPIGMLVAIPVILLITTFIACICQCRTDRRSRNQLAMKEAENRGANFTREQNISLSINDAKKNDDMLAEDDTALNGELE